jgi:hypothetical protein
MLFNIIATFIAFAAMSAVTDARESWCGCKQGNLQNRGNNVAKQACSDLGWKWKSTIIVDGCNMGSSSVDYYLGIYMQKCKDINSAYTISSCV